MNIIIDKEKKTWIIDGINAILSLDSKTFDTLIERLSVRKGVLKDIQFFYTSDSCENASAEIQLGLEKIYGENGQFISRAYFGGEKFSISRIFKVLGDRLKQSEEYSEEYIRTTMFY